MMFTLLFARLLTKSPKVNALSTDLRRNARIMDELDVALGFANLATEMNFTRPVLKDE
jgi:DNA mismatch repair ATPase MutS